VPSACEMPKPAVFAVVATLRDFFSYTVPVPDALEPVQLALGVLLRVANLSFK